VSSTGYRTLGWLVWKIGSRVARRKLSQNRSKLAAVVTILLVVLAGIALTHGDQEDE